MSKDLLSNMLSTIQNAALVKKEFVEVPFSNECLAVAEVLKNHGYLTDVKTFKEKGKYYKKLRLDIAYKSDGTPKLSSVQRVSKPGRRLYKGTSAIGSVMGGYGLLVVSTSRGVMSGEEAKKKKLGGEVVCRIF